MKNLCHLLLLPFLFSTAAIAQEKSPPTFSRAEITRTAALKMIESAIADAEKRKEVVAVAVCDLGGHLIAFARMDDAKPAVVQIATDKAYSSAIYRATTGKLWELSQPGAEGHGLQNVPRTITMKGGVPVKHNGVVIGGIGVSGAAAQVDEDIAQKAAETVFGSQNQPR